MPGTPLNTLFEERDFVQLTKNDFLEDCIAHRNRTALKKWLRRIVV